MSGGVAAGATVLALILALIAAPVVAAAGTTVDEDAVEAWEPGAGERTDLTRDEPDFRGMGYLFPLRLHLRRGGYVDGAMGGLDPGAHELLLVRPMASFRISIDLISAVTPLGTLPEPGQSAAEESPPSPLDRSHYERRLLPTWRSGVGLAMSALLPGTGQFIQKRDQALGALFLAGDIFFIGMGVLALLAPSSMSRQNRSVAAVGFFVVAATLHVSSAGLAWRTGMERQLVSIDGNGSRPHRGKSHERDW